MSEPDEGEGRGLSWLARPLECDGQIVLNGLNPEHLSDSDLRGICLRMHVILHTAEMPRCEGRLIPVDIFDRMDTLESMVLYGHGGEARLAEWAALIRDFGAYQGLKGPGPITVNPAYYSEIAARYATPQPAKFKEASD